jgi:hypothetical protein
VIAEDGTVVGTVERGERGHGQRLPVTAGTTASIVAGAVTTRLPVTKGREYQVSNFSDDGRSAAGYSVYPVGDKVGNEPVAWRCQAG